MDKRRGGAREEGRRAQGLKPFLSASNPCFCCTLKCFKSLSRPDSPGRRVEGGRKEGGKGGVREGGRWRSREGRGRDQGWSESPNLRDSTK